MSSSIFEPWFLADLGVSSLRFSTLKNAKKCSKIIYAVLIGKNWQIELSLDNQQFYLFDMYVDRQYWSYTALGGGRGGGCCFATGLRIAAVFNITFLLSNCDF